MHTTGSGRRLLVAAATLIALSAAACSSSTPGSKHSTPPPSSPKGSSPASTAPAGGGTPDAAAVAAIKQAYAKFFAPNTPEQVSLGLLQNGQALKSAVDQQGKSSYAQKSSASVSSVSLISANTAKVAYTISVNGQALLKDQPGYAVKENGTWKVAEYTFCTLLRLQGGAPAECNSATATTVPK